MSSTVQTTISLRPLPADHMARPVLCKIHIKKAVKNDDDDDDKDYIFKMFLKREPKTLGAVQIMIAIVTIGCGVILMLSPPSLVMITRIPFGTSLMFLFSGALSIAVERFRKVLQVCVCINIVSFIYAGIGIILYSVDLSFWNSYTTSTALNLTTAEIKGLMCMLAVLELCITAALLKSRLATTPTSPEND
ncbi:membrane-spanning 4-domains subfamily A member 4D-like isoform X2 [Polyodon spathula]|uniref:membrane-spanning 4-domains subfamily A member 4D-like isoform X2 n=1 Tax=Polyodon spathula TaxID=7913 RepID=UPI001B7F0665|nr:membrane-spanning 4-domains subfamily A member 4D-like isoform X2 [Polyodon spathula]